MLQEKSAQGCIQFALEGFQSKIQEHFAPDNLPQNTD
jgi:hypothetical protein